MVDIPLTAVPADAIQQVARPLVSAADLDPLLGEASHGTSEYYVWRMRLSKRLIEEKGFSFIAVEGDWPDCYRVNRYVKGYDDSGDSAYEVLHAFERWPSGCASITRASRQSGRWASTG